MHDNRPDRGFAGYPLLDALRDRRSRRFGLGMKMDAGAFPYQSSQAAVPLSEEEEALLAFAACGITGYALGDLVYGPGQGGTILARLLGRTIPSGDAINAVSLVVTNDHATYLMKRPQDFAPEEVPELASLAKAGEFVELYRRSRIQVKASRTSPPQDPLYNLHVNDWSLYDPASSYFLPLNELTFLYINGVLEIMDEATGAYIVDERAGFQPAGVGRFARSRGGHLNDDVRDGLVGTIQGVESLVSEFVTVEQGAMVQNLLLMIQALGLGGFPHWAAHPFGWLKALGFRMLEMPSTRYLGVSPLLARLARIARKPNPLVPYAVGLDVDDQPVLHAFCPPYFPTMEAAVRAVVDAKFGPGGTYRGGAAHSGWRDPQSVSKAAAAPSNAAVDATIAYCTYVYERYRRFPTYSPPFRTVIGVQASHLDLDFYDRFYHNEALSDTQRQHMARWHTPVR